VLVRFGVPMAVPDEDAVLVRSAIGGDDEAFTELVRRHKGTVLRSASRFARNPEELEDLGQETFLRVYRTSAPFAATPLSGIGCRGSRCAYVTTRYGNDAGRRRMFRWRSWPRRSRILPRERPFRPIGPHDPRPGDVAPQTGGPAGDHAVRTRDRSVREVAVLTGGAKRG